MNTKLQSQNSLHPASCILYPSAAFVEVGAASRAALTRASRPRLGRPTRAFTLVELLVVITIIGILAALIVVAAVGALKTAQRVRIKAEITQIAGGLDEYKNKVT